MKPNQKLTHAIQDRTAASVENAPDGLTLPFEGGATKAPAGASVVQAFERQDRLKLHFSQGLPAAFTLTNPGNAVAVPDATGKVVYLG